MKKNYYIYILLSLFFYTCLFNELLALTKIDWDDEVCVEKILDEYLDGFMSTSYANACPANDNSSFLFTFNTQESSPELFIGDTNNTLTLTITNDIKITEQDGSIKPLTLIFRPGSPQSIDSANSISSIYIYLAKNLRLSATQFNGI